MGRPRKRRRDDEQLSATESRQAAIPAPQAQADQQPPPQAQQAQQQQPFSPGNDLTQEIYDNFLNPGVLTLFERNVSQVPPSEVLHHEQQSVNEALSGIFSSDLMHAGRMGGTSFDFMDPMLQTRYVP